MTPTEPLATGRQRASHPSAGRPGARRVLFVITTSDVGGTESMLRALAIGLDRSAFQPIVCSLCPPGQAGQQVAAAGIPVFTLGMSSRPRLAELATASVRLARRIDDLGIDLVQSLLYRANALAGIAARLSRRRPVVVAGQRSLTPWSGWPAGLAARWTWGLTDRIVAVSEAVKRELEHTDRIAPDRIVVIPNGVDTNHYDATSGTDARAQLGMDPRMTVVGGVGRLSREKGFDRLIASVALAHQQGARLHLVLAGDGPQRSALEEQARALQLDGHAHFFGVREDLRPFYAAMDVFVLPSLEEGSPNALLEAMACGRAVIASRVGGVDEIVRDEHSGLLVPPGAPAALTEAIIRVTADDALKQRLGAEARRRVHGRFSVARMVEGYTQLYRELLALRGA